MHNDVKHKSFCAERRPSWCCISASSGASTDCCSIIDGEESCVQIGPALSALDADVSYQAGPVQRAKDYKKAAQHSAAAQEARGMLGKPVSCHGGQTRGSM